MKEEEDGTKTIASIGTVDLNEIVNSIEKDSILYLFMRQQNESIQLLNVPVKGKNKTKENPDGWATELQARTVKEPLTLQITEEDDIARYVEYINSINI